MAASVVREKRRRKLCGGPRRFFRMAGHGKKRLIQRAPHVYCAFIAFSPDIRSWFCTSAAFRDCSGYIPANRIWFSLLETGFRAESPLKSAASAYFLNRFSWPIPAPQPFSPPPALP
ncbi:hypothetical protein [uncultured Ottowia sp.]|uniref:hypothetical protein n=1 Tax=uncultured Ottowia sp. TaxID=543067 RepID=UPI002598A73A|nr:hypothetical protein [uncultured Ottowia sp.]